jgi:transposase, IS5 family
MDQPAPDHSTFSRFRSRLSKKAMVQLNSALLAQLNQHGVTINEGIAVDARLIRSASKPVSNEKLNELREKQNSAEGNMDKNGKPKNSPAILNRTGPSKTMCLTMG